MTDSRVSRPGDARRLTAALVIAGLAWGLTGVSAQAQSPLRTPARPGELPTPQSQTQAPAPDAPAPEAGEPQAGQQPPENPMSLEPPAALAPPRALKPAGPAAPQAAPARQAEGPAAERNRSGTGSEPGVEVDTLATVDPETVGTLGPDSGGLGFNLWQGADRAFVAALIAEMPVRAPSQVMRDLMRRMLLTAAQPPASRAPVAPAEGDAAPVKKQSLISLRVQQLAAMGDVPGVGELLAVVPGTVSDPALLQVEANARFLANDNARACGITAQEVQAGVEAAYWQKAMIFCQILAGEPEKAEIGISMLNELGAKEPTFYALTDRLLGGATGELSTVSNADGLLLAMARASKTPLPADATRSNRPGVLRAIAQNPNVAPDIRLEAAERAEAAGAFDTEALRQLYATVSFEQEDLNRPLSRAEEIGGPLARALLYRSALLQKIPTAQAEIIGKALQIAVGEGRYGAAARVFQPLISKIPPSADLLWFAPNAVRLMLSNNDPEGAEAWFKLLQASALFQDDSKALLIRLTPLVRLVGTMGLENEPRDLNVWWRSVAEEPDAARRAALLYSLLDGLGDFVPLDAWQAMGPVTGRSAVDTVHPALWFRLIAMTDAVNDWTARREAREAAFLADAAAGAPVAEPVQEAQLAASGEGQVLPAPPEQAVLPPHRGEILLMALSVLGDAGPAQAGAAALRQVVESLRAIGLEQEARDLALEAALSAGL
ncbi:MAG TPA: hypothetical protein DCG48_14030 [Rhodospirillaceae bacterium]|mgnify:CR=1 FL=1|nr:hypothetical protein [Rhodospirillaceae bacterium]|tara:strand:+ start:282 stop:2441 length:2160 start_codon:yes stop_codon:yes gene_type:complete